MLHLNPIKRRIKVLIVASLLSCSIGFPGSVLAEDDLKANLLHVLGRSSLEIVPDVATWNIGFEHNAKTPASAQSSVTREISALLNELRRIGLKSEEIQTSQASIQPIYEYINGQQKLSSYTAVQTITIRLIGPERLTLLNKILEITTNTGVNHLDSPNFSVSPQKNDEYQTLLLKMATLDGLEQAKTVLNTLNCKIKQIKSIEVHNQENQFFDRSRLFSASSAGFAKEANPQAIPEILPGVQQINSSIRLIIEFTE